MKGWNEFNEKFEDVDGIVETFYTGFKSLKL